MGHVRINPHNREFNYSSGGTIHPEASRRCDTRRIEVAVGVNWVPGWDRTTSTPSEGIVLPLGDPAFARRIENGG